MAGKSRTMVLAVIVVILTVIAIAFWHFSSAPTGKKDLRDYISFFNEVVALVKTSYVEKIDDKKLMENAIGGMLASLDPHSTYLPPEPYKEMQIQMSGSFAGIGIEVTLRDGKLTVISPIEDTPAFHAGIKPGDLIWRIDSTFTRTMGIDEAVRRMRGPQGSKVSLTVLREGMEKPLVIHLKREIIRITSVRYRTPVKGYGYIKIAQFQERTGEEFAKALEELHRENRGGLRGLVLDLRNNPGGLVDPAIEVAGRFTGEELKDSLIVSLKGRDPSSQKDLSATIGKKEPHYPMVVLINNGSASASEIVAGALQDYKRAVIMGTQSFGKGSVQSVIPLNGGAALKLTTARYYTPKGRSIQARGITPDVIVSADEKAGPVKDLEMNLREEDLDGHFEPDDGKRKTLRKDEQQSLAHKGVDLTGDYQLSRALDLLRGIDLLEKLK